MADEKPQKKAKAAEGKPAAKPAKGAKGEGKKAAAAPEPEKATAKPTTNLKGGSRLRQKYINEIRPALMKQFEIVNPMAAPKLHKVVVNMGMGEATQNAKLIDPAANELGQITGQKPVITKAKKSIAAFKVREGMPIGAMVTLRGDRMYEFLDRLMNVALPRVRDFRGVPGKSFDGRGNYTLGMKDQLVFPEIDYSKVEKAKGMNITVVTTAQTDDQGRALLKMLGMPFRA